MRVASSPEPNSTRNSATEKDLGKQEIGGRAEGAAENNMTTEHTNEFFL